MTRRPEGETFWLLGRAWDVDALNGELDRHPEQVISVRPENLVNDLTAFVRVDHSRLDDLEHPERPVVVLGYRTQHGPVVHFVVDGNHRIARARARGDTLIQAFIVGPDDEPRYRLN